MHQVISSVDQASSQAPEMVDGQYTVSAKRKSEAYNVIHSSDDEVFQTDLYDWYLAKGWTERLLEVVSPYIVTYLQRKSSEDIAHADLLWNYYARSNQFYDAAAVQSGLAKSDFSLGLDKRIEYLSRAKANASTSTLGIARQPRQLLLHEISDLLDVGNIQDDLLQRLKEDARITPERRPQILKELNGQILSLTEVPRNNPELLVAPANLCAFSYTTTMQIKLATSICASSSTKPPTIGTQQTSKPPGKTY